MPNLKKYSAAKKEAAREILKRRAARKGLIAFTEYTLHSYVPSRHHHLIADKLEAVERGEVDRLMIFMPPRHGKSELASKRFPSWYLGRNPTKQIITASYASDLATDFGREVRNIVAGEEYAALFDTKLRQDSKAANRWHTSDGGVYVAAGVGTATTGRGADLGLIDDPFKDREDADSQLKRDKVWNWYQSTFYTRLMPGAAIILVQTRWHENDLAGRLLEAEKNGGDHWEILDLPAIDKDNQALWPEWFPLSALLRIKAAIGPREWSALYQQKPQPEEGTYFQRDWFRWYDPNNPPKHVNKYVSTDFAVTEGDGDWTELGVFGSAPGDDLYILDWWSGQETADKWIDALLDLVKDHRPMALFGETGSIRRSIEPFLTKRMRERRDYCRVEWITRTKDKATSARAFQARCSMGKVYLPDNDMGREILDQLLRFPTGKHDDKVDVCALMGMVLDQAHPAVVVAEKKKRVGRWDRAFAGTEDSSWKTI